MTALQIGAAGEAFAASEFSRAGCQVYVPLGDGSAADLVVDFGGRLHRIQVKTSSIESNRIEFKTRRKFIPHGSCAYEAGDIDWYALVSLYHRRVSLIAFDRAYRQGMTIRYAYEFEHHGAMDADDCDLEKVVSEYRALV